MSIGLVGRKCGMTRVFTDGGDSVAVTVVEVLPNRVTQVKTEERDGYRAVQVTYGERRPQLLTKAVSGHYAKASVAPGRSLIELPANTEMVMPGDNIKMNVDLIAPIAMEEGLRFAIREGGRTVGAGVVSKVIK